MECKPFKRYFNTYHNVLLYKIFLKAPWEPENKIRATLEEAMEIIRQASNISGGMPQIVYLVGWQFLGHDSKYPAWSEVGKHCFYKDCPDPLTSLRTMMRDAMKQYNVKVSLHINMDDATEDSPLWPEYKARNLINIDEKGAMQSGGVWGGGMTYEISKTREWECGLAQRRIDSLLEMIPEIKEAGTIHIDAFRPKTSKGLGTTFEDEVETAKKIFTYWHNAGVDVTNEFLPCYEFIGYVPMVWALNLDEEGRLKYPPDVLCGGTDSWNRRRKNFIYDHIGWGGSYSVPAAGCLYDAAWGTSISRDLYMADGYRVCDIVDVFYRKTVPWHFLNRFRALELRQSKGFYRVIFSDGVESAIDCATGAQRITWHGRNVYSDGNVCVSDNWSSQANNQRFLLYSEHGGSVTFELPETCAVYRSGRLRKLSLETPELMEKNLAVNEGKCTVTLPARTPFSLELY